MKNFASGSLAKLICVILMPIVSYFLIFMTLLNFENINNGTFSISENTPDSSSKIYLEEGLLKYNFLKSEQCKNLLEDDAYYLCSLFADNPDIPSDVLSEYSNENSNLKVLVYSTSAEGTVSLFFNNQFDISEGLSKTVQLVKSGDPDTTIFAELTLDSRLQKYDKYREAYETYYYLSDNGELIIISNIILFLLFISILCLLCAGAGRRKNSTALVINFYSRIPLEILILFYGLIIFISGPAVSAFGSIPYFDNSTIFIKNAFWSVIPWLALNIIIVPLIVSMAVRIKASTNNILPFWKNFITLKIFYFIFLFLKKASRFIIKNSSSVFSGLLGFIVYIFINFILIIVSINTNGMFIILYIAFNICAAVLICLFLSNLDRLKKETKNLENGEYTITDSNSYLLFFRAFAESLNHTKEGMSAALEKSIKSERFKTELITNVSHDLKTPLTSIINYVDLMKNEDPNSPKAKEYLEILDKQSKRLKHLIEDLIEVSKASTGNIKAELSEIDIEEFLSQVNGEFFDRLESSMLTAVTEHHEKNLKITADGTLLWRIFNNLFSNICKYSLPGTRVYISTCRNGKNAEITIKNISADPLNISADVLTERFVRGDASRHSEGSGLGLSIAKSLTEAQNGSFEIEIDGDLFKVIMNFPLFDKTYEAALPAENKESASEIIPEETMPEISEESDFYPDKIYSEIYNEDILKSGHL